MYFILKKKVAINPTSAQIEGSEHISYQKDPGLLGTMVNARSKQQMHMMSLEDCIRPERKETVRLLRCHQKHSGANLKRLSLGKNGTS